MRFEPEMKDLKKAVPEVSNLSDSFQVDLLQFACEVFKDGQEDGKEDDEHNERQQILGAYYEYEHVTSWDEFVAKRAEMFSRTLSGL